MQGERVIEFPAGNIVLSDSPPPQPFPLESLPEPASEFAQAVADSVGCPVDFPAAGILAAMSATVGATRRIVVRTGWSEPASLYIALVGPSGSGKSPALQMALKPLPSVLAATCSSADWKSLVVHEATTEALTLAMREHRRGVLLHADELTGLFASFGAYRGGRGADRQFYLSAWKGDEKVLARVNRAQGPRKAELISVDAVPLTIVGGVVPENSAVFGAGKELNDGLLQRFLFVVPSVEQTAAPRPLPSSLMARYQRLLHAMASASRAPDFVVHDCDAELMDAFMEDLLEHSCADVMRAHIPKLKAYWARLALLLHQADLAIGKAQGESVEGAWVAAYDLIQYFLDHACRAQALARGSTTAGRVTQLAEVARTADSISLREVYTRKVGGVKSREEALELLTEAQRMGLGRIVTEKPKSGGREVIRFLFQRRGKPNS